MPGRSTTRSRPTDAADVLVLYHDIPSAASLLAVLRLQALADEGLPVSFAGFDVLGLDATIPATVVDLEDWERHRDEAAALRWELPRPRLHPPTLTAHLLAELAEEEGLGAAWRLAVYRAYWLEAADLGDPVVLLDLARATGLPTDEAERLVDDPQHRHRLRRRMLVHRGEGVGGVPVLDVRGTFVSPFMDAADLRHLADL